MSEPGAATWSALGTTASLWLSDSAALSRARRIVEDELAAIDLACSRFRHDSELSRVNAAGGARVAVSPLMLEAVTVALRAAELTDGIVDPTVGEALILAGYDRDFAELDGEPPVLVGRRVPGWTQVSLDRARRTLRVPHGTLLDLGATAKALAADRAAAAVAAELPGLGVLVNLGGDLATGGPAPAGGWLVRIADDHNAPADEPGPVVAIGSGALATSSTTVRRWGKTAHHLIDPRTGLPAVSPWRTVSVAAASCVDANTASTAAIVLDYDAPKWLAERKLPARLVDHDGRVTAVAGWPAEAVAA